MGRRKNLSEEELLDRAMHVFRRDGFAGASAEVLVRETGASRYNLINDRDFIGGFIKYSF